jgi:hypothetical protein
MPGQLLHRIARRLCPAHADRVLEPLIMVGRVCHGARLHVRAPSARSPLGCGGIAEHETCAAVIDRLVASAFLRWTATGAVTRVEH